MTEKPTNAEDQVPAPAGPTFEMPDDSAAYRLAERAVWHLLEMKAEQCLILDLRGRSDVCDFFVIAEGAADVQVKALARHLRDSLLAAGHRAQSVEGMEDGRWALLDFFDVVVHVFHTEARQYYQLERLWGDGARLDIEPDWYAGAEVAGRHPDLKFTPGPAAGQNR